MNAYCHIFLLCSSVFSYSVTVVEVCTKRYVVLHAFSFSDNLSQLKDEEGWYFTSLSVSYRFILRGTSNTVPVTE